MGLKISAGMNRRTFLALSSAGVLTLPVLASTHGPDNFPKLGKIALQLYTVRREIEKDLMGTLEKVAQIGFTRVETAFWPEHVSVKQAAEAFKSFGMKVCSIHCELPIGEDRNKMLELAEAYNCKLTIWHGWPEDPRYMSSDGIKELADIYNEANHFAGQNGLQFGLHNHWWEFLNQVDGKYPYQIIQPLLDEDIFFELDTYWIKVAGLDPSKIVGQFANKAPLLHIKDGPARYSESLGEDEPEPMVAVGQGSQDFPGVVKAAGGHTQFMVVEMDKTSVDVFKALKDSYQYLIENKLATNN